LQTSATIENEGGLRNILILAESPDDTGHHVRLINLPGSFVGIEVDEAEVQA
jgi:hypothetical protein